VIFFVDFPSNLSISVASQHDLQVLLDDHQHEQFLASLSIWERAHFTALSHSLGISLKFGFSIPGPELVVSFHLWLGISLFPVSPLCVCLSTIDNGGDHLLECSHGSMCIHQHDALVDIVYHTLSQSHFGALKEQCISGDDQSPPGDVFHPDFQYVLF